jgi:hypothetical protein
MIRRFRIKKVSNGWGTHYYIEQRVAFWWERYNRPVSYATYDIAKREVERMMAYDLKDAQRSAIKMNTEYYYPPLPDKEQHD